MERAPVKDTPKRRQWMIAALMWVAGSCAFVFVAIGATGEWMRALPYNANFSFWARVPFINTVYRYSTDSLDSAASSGPLIDIESYHRDSKFSGGSGQTSFNPREMRNFEMGSGNGQSWMKAHCEVRGFDDRNVLLNITFSGGADNPDAIAHPDVHSTLVTLRPGEPVILYPYDNVRVVLSLRDPSVPFKGYSHLMDPI